VTGDGRIWVPGSGQTGAQSQLPAGAVAGGGWIEPKLLRVPLAKVNGSGTQRTSVSVAARIDNPAARLVCSFSIGFEPEVPQTIADYQSSVWSADGIRPGAAGREAGLHNIFATQPLPELYEISSALRAVQVSATLQIPLTAGAAAIPGLWVLVVEWEPAMPMCEAEVAALYSRCGARGVLDAAGPLAP
jgi:hypothetical protein